MQNQANNQQQPQYGLPTHRRLPDGPAFDTPFPAYFTTPNLAQAYQNHPTNKSGPGAATNLEQVVKAESKVERPRSFWDSVCCCL